jgi:hypothetical protein
VLLAARALFARWRDRLGFAATSFVPPLWTAAAVLAVCAVGPLDSPLWALARSVAVALACLPIVWLFGRGLGVRALLDTVRGRLGRGNG